MISNFISSALNLSLSTSLFVIVLTLFLYETIFKTWNYFTNRGLKYIRGPPIFGIIGESIFGRVHPMQIVEKVYRQYPNEQIIGTYTIGGRPVYFVRDPEVVRDISIRNFDHFSNHRFTIDEEVEPLLGKSLFFMKTPKWRDMRQILSPAFTGSKMRLMFGLINEYNVKFMVALKRLTKDPANRDVELRDLFTRCATDIIGTCAFGLEVDSIGDKTNEFYMGGEYLTASSLIRSLKLLGHMAFPNVFRYFRIQIIDNKWRRYFRELVLGSMNYREEHSIVRHDMINLLMMARNGALAHQNDDPIKDDESGGVDNATITKDPESNKVQQWDDDDFVAQCIIFFFAGFDTVSTLLTFMAHELTVNPDAQEKLYQTIIDTQKEIGDGGLTYDVLIKMKYLDMVVSETLRKWNPTILSGRQATKAYTLSLSNGNSVHFNPGDNITIPTTCFHLDPNYFPNPTKFDPERFSSENASKIVPGSYIPFGSGPRNCIGSRFALMEVKSIIFNILANFKLERTARTVDPIVLKPRTFNLVTEGGFWIKFIPRD